MATCNSKKLIIPYEQMFDNLFDSIIVVSTKKNICSIDLSK